MTDDATTPRPDDPPSAAAGDPPPAGADTPRSPHPGADTPRSPGPDDPPFVGATGPADPGGGTGTVRPDDGTGRRGRTDPAARRRRRLLVGGGVAAAVLVLLVCGVLGAAAAGFGRLANRVERGHEVRDRAETACQDLERRLNRLVPPGAARNPGQRASAIRDENAALRPFLSEIERLPGWRDDDDDDEVGDGRLDAWRRLVDARSSYADALDRQVTAGEPAFFVAPRDHRGRPVLERLTRGPESCAAAARRLAAPDL
ncbi:hypothetical protein [Plantactinospora sp. B5E13]|uniref:hypothetical protein n=1 Tax=Plantactinospora sp. B5E13 TaxID=3153758 RepID=UPI00325E05B7